MIDVHTHTASSDPRRILCLDPTDALCVAPSGQPFSVGIHPWRVHEYLAHDHAAADERLHSLAASDTCVAIGETGFDRNAAASLAEQEEVLRAHIRLSEQLRKPLVVHLVGQSARLIALHREYAPAQPWVVHGFRGKPELARQLLAEGFFLSFGPQFNPAALAATPDDRLLLETDDAPTAPTAVAALHAPTRVAAAEANARRIFGL